MSSYMAVIYDAITRKMTTKVRHETVCYNVNLSQRLILLKFEWEISKMSHRSPGDNLIKRVVKNSKLMFKAKPGDWIGATQGNGVGI